jgi:hypothetical protein
VVVRNEYAKSFHTAVPFLDSRRRESMQLGPAEAASRPPFERSRL